MYYNLLSRFHTRQIIWRLLRMKLVTSECGDSTRYITVKPGFHLVVIVVNKSLSAMRNSPPVNLSLFLYSKRSLLIEHTQKYFITATLTCSRQLRLNGDQALRQTY